MGKAVKSVVGKVTGALGLGGGGSGSGAGDPNAAFFDIANEAKPFQAQQQQLGQQSFAQALQSGELGGQVLQQMGEAALGRGPSLAEAQLKAAQDRNLAQQLAATRGGRGGSAAANQRALIQSMGQQGRALAQDAAQARLQERSAFQQALAGTQALARQDVGAGFELAAAPKRERQQAELARAQADLTRTQARKQQQSAIGGQLLGAGAAFLLSDKNEKMAAKKDGKKYTDFLDKLQAYSYEYKDTSLPGTSPGRKHGIMAQDLEKSEIGKSMVQEVGGRKMVDIASGFGAVLASQAELNKRLKNLEKKKGKA